MSTPFDNPDVDDFKFYFQRDFPYGDDDSGFDFVLGADIQKAINTAATTINQALFPDKDTYDIYFNNLAAHYLVMSLRASAQGIAGQFPWMTTSKGVGSVSAGIEWPDWVKANPEMVIFTQTNYGAAYLAYLIPQLRGSFGIVCGRTLP